MEVIVSAVQSTASGAEATAVTRSGVAVGSGSADRVEVEVRVEAGRCRSRSDESQCSTEQSDRRNSGENGFVDLGHRYVVCVVCMSRGLLVSR